MPHTINPDALDSTNCAHCGRYNDWKIRPFKETFRECMHCKEISRVYAYRLFLVSPVKKSKVKTRKEK